MKLKDSTMIFLMGLLLSLFFRSSNTWDDLFNR